LEEKTKYLEDSHHKIDELNSEKNMIFEQKNDLLNRLTEKMNQNDDLNDKIKKLEYKLSYFDKSKDEDFNLNSYNGGGVFLDLLGNKNNEENEQYMEDGNENQDNYTINMKVKMKDNKAGKFMMNRNDDKRRKTLMEISDMMQQKPLSKV
jgi:hypothetical protein